MKQRNILGTNKSQCLQIEATYNWMFGTGHISLIDVDVL